MAVALQKLHRQLDQGQSADLVNGNVASPPPAEVERLRQENTQYKQQVEVSKRWHRTLVYCCECYGD